MNIKAINQFWTKIKNNFIASQLSFASCLLIFISSLLLFIFSLPDVIALRKLLLLIAFLIAFGQFWQVLQKKPKPLLHTVAILLFLQIWMLVISGFISDQPMASLSEWKGQWLPAFMSFAIGIGLANTLMQSKLKHPRIVVAMSILVPITIYLCANAVVVIHDMIFTDTFPTQQSGLSDHKANVGYLIALLEPILIAEMLGRLFKGKSLLPIPGWLVTIIFLLAIFALLTASARNGIILMLMALVMGAVMMYSEIQKAYPLRRIFAFIAATAIGLSALVFISYRTDPRWQNFIETVPLAWNIDRNLIWLNGDGTDLPVTSNGMKVDASAYYRIAWAHEGWRMLMAHPWGMEMSRYTFHTLVLDKFGHAGMAHSHNSWIDLGLEIGIPALLLWGLILLIMAKFGWQKWQTQKDPLGLALTILVIMFAVRGLLDSIFRDHEIEQFMLVAGLLFSTLSFGTQIKRKL